MASEKKFSDPEKGGASADEEETALANDTETIEMLPQKKDMVLKPKHSANEFYGLSKEELEKFANDPFWVKVRWILFAIFLVGWIAMLVVAIVIVVLAAKCPPRPNMLWWQKDVAYSVSVGQFYDSNNDKIGDLKGIAGKLEYFQKIGVKTVILSPIYQESGLKDVRTGYGTMDDFQALVKQMHKKGMHVVLEIEAAHMNATNVVGTEVLEFWLSKGADGFAIASAADAVADAHLQAWKAKLDEYATKTDQPRVLIVSLTQVSTSSSAMNSTADLLVDRSFTKFDSDCVGSCVQNLIKGIRGVTVDDQGWPSFVIGDSHSPRIASRAGDNLELLVTAQLTLKGTPIIYYGDEIGMQTLGNEAYMQWISSLDTWNASNSKSLFSSVQAQTATGFKRSLLKHYHDLTKLRAKESLQWGSTKIGNCSGLVTYTRAAEGFPGYLVALNMAGTASHPGRPFVGDLAGCSGNSATKGIVAAVVLTGSAEIGSDVEVDQEIDISNVFLPIGAGLVVRLSG